MNKLYSRKEQTKVKLVSDIGPWGKDGCAIIVRPCGQLWFEPKDMTVEEVYKEFEIDDDHIVMLNGEELLKDYIIQCGDMLVVIPPCIS